MRSAVLACALLALAAGPARANGRPPATSTIHFEAGAESNIVAGMTFGLIVSHDGGATWQWMCEDAVGYGGMYDPFYGYAATGTLFATTFDGLKASRNGCTFDPLASGSDFASTATLGPDGAYYYGESTATSSKIFKSIDDGASFGSGVTPPNGMPNDWWQSLTVAPSDAQRVYLFGYRFDADNQKTFLLYKSTDGGASFSPISTATFVTSQNSAIEVVAVDRANPDVLYAHVTAQDGMKQHGLYRSTDAGATWTALLTVSDTAFAVLLRANGDLLVGTDFAGVSLSHDQGATWSTIATAPHINCLAETSAGAIWACTENYSIMGGPPSDNAGIMTSTDAVTWTTVMKYQDITGPVSCAAGTVQHDDCQVMTWCGLKAQLGITSNAIACAGAVDQPPALEAPVLASHGGGCCDAGDGAPDTGVLSLALGLGLAWWRRPARGKHQKETSC